MIPWKIFQKENNMKYMGSKARIAKDILPIILKDRKEGQWYVEPFVGGCNTIDKVTGNRIGADIHKELIAMWKAIQEGWNFPDTITEEDYYNIRYGDYPDYLKGYVGFNASYSGKWWGGMARYVSPSGKKQHFDKEAYRFVTRQVPFVKDIIFHNCSYESLDIPENSIIYCDPPYRGTTSYKNKLDYDHFYGWCRLLKKQGHKVYISEYQMPKDFKCLWEKKRRSSLTQDGGSWKTERLFTI